MPAHPHPRRRFLRHLAQAVPWTTAASLGLTFSPGSAPVQSCQKSVPDLLDIDCRNGADLQAILHQHAGSEKTLRITTAKEIVCLVSEESIHGEQSRHALLIPERLHLDLNGSTLLLDCRTNSYGVRLSSHSSISNGTIRVVRSENKGSQACWHSGISVGAAYGDGGTTAMPGRFSKVSHWSINNITIDQPFEAAAIQLMSEACHGAILNVTVLDSSKALLGIGMDWGSVGPITSEDQRIADMRRLWEQGQIYSTHPHDILVENLRVGRLTRNMDGNDAGVRCSACHNITIRNVQIDEAGVAVAIWGGDCGYEFAREADRSLQHSGYVVENVTIDRALLFGLVLNGSADNVYRARRDLGYQTLIDPVHPGLNRPIIRNCNFSGSGDRINRQGIYAVAVTDGRFEHLSISGFNIGVHVEDWVRNLEFRKTTFRDNRVDHLIEGATEPAVGVTFVSED